MNPKTDAIPFIQNNLGKYGIEWINKGRISDDFKFLIFGKVSGNKQIGIYGRATTILRLEKYDQNIDGVEVQTKCAKSHAAEASFSNFKNEKGVCVKVENTIALQKLLDWYYGV